MDEAKKQNPQSQASTRQSKPYEIFGDETERLKRYPKAAPPPPPVKCEFCGRTLYAHGFELGTTIHWIGAERCTCEKAIEKEKREEAERLAEKKRNEEAERNRQLQERVRKIVGQSGIGARFRLRTFETFELTDENQKAALLCQKYADTFREKLPTKEHPNPGRNGLFITGPKGTGKTHLVAAIANKLMNQGIPVICMTMIDLLERIKSTYTNTRQRFGGGYDAADILDAYTDVSLLIVDDLGKEQATEWAISRIYAIINARYEALMPTIITTNYSEAELLRRLTPKETNDDTTADATIDRLREMCAAIVTTGNSWRSK